MSTTDTKADFGAWWLQTHTFDGPATIEDVARRAFDAGHQAATEAAKATSVAVGELSESQKIAMQYGQQLNDAEANAFVSGIELGKELAARQPAPVAEIEPCGGCGNTDPDKRCIGCYHQFGQVAPECTFSEDEIYDIERCLRTGVTMGYTEKKGAEKALAIFKAATNRSQP